MPQLDKVLHGNLDEIEKKLNGALFAQIPLLCKRGSWTTTAGGVTCRMLVYEQNAKRIWDKEAEEWKEQPHYSLSITMVDTGEEVRLCGITAGSSQDMYFIPDSGAEYGMFEALSITLDMWDFII